MPTVTVEGEKSFAVAPDRKLVLAIEDAGSISCTAAAVTRAAPPAGSRLSRASPGRWVSWNANDWRARHLSAPTSASLAKIRVSGDLDVRVLTRKRRRHHAGGTTRRLNDSTYFCGSEHFLHRTERRRTRPPHRLHLWNFNWRDFFLRGRNGTDTSRIRFETLRPPGARREVA